MSNSQKLTRSGHVASLELPPGTVLRTLGHLRRRDVLVRISLCAFTAIVVWAVCRAWAPPFEYRIGQAPRRDVVARVGFSVPDPERTQELRKQKRSETRCVYTNDDQPLKEIRSALKDRMFQILAAGSYQELDLGIWGEFLTEVNESTQLSDELAFNGLRSALADDKELAHFTEALQRALQQFEEHGLLEGLQHSPAEGSQISILVHPLGKEDFPRRVDVADVRIAEAATDLQQRLAKEFSLAELPAEEIDVLAQLVASWLTNHQLPTTLTLDLQATRLEYEKSVSNLHVDRHFNPGDTLARGGIPLTPDKLALLAREYTAAISERTVGESIVHSLAYLGMYVGLFLLGGTYVYRYQRAILADLRRFATMLGAAATTIILAKICQSGLWRAEIVPVVLFGMTAAVAYRRELALLLSTVVALEVSISVGMSLGEFATTFAAVSATILLLNRVRSRTKLIYVGLAVGFVTMLTVVGIGIVEGRPLLSVGGTGLSLPADPHGAVAAFLARLFTEASWQGFCVVLASLIMTGLLPFVERLFDVQTDISLLELGDAAHPLLQQLARRAPGTYNHSINVAAMAEAAAEAIGANGLLTRVGTYFHDIGKMFKPAYFVENQGREDSRHQSLMPAMSTLVIIAHVKDGADLARQHHLPRSVIDFIEQHHGTTLVEYFYQQATKQREDDPDSEEVEERSFRYPGPKPQTRETGVLMLADAVESMSRTLVDPTPARIENVVQDIAMRRLLDGQFDECGITLKELSVVQESLSKSLVAVYHARVKYPDQQTA